LKIYQLNSETLYNIKILLNNPPKQKGKWKSKMLYNWVTI